jgi:RimJ/RimL family protein N-acetyltransferase
MDIPIIETPRLLLRQFRQSDLDAYAAICADEEVMRYIGEGRPLTRSETWRNMATVLGHWHLRGYGLWAVELKRTGLEAGWLLEKSSWGQGLATEGASAALDYAFRELGRDHVISLIRPENARSIRVAERLGEKYEGRVDLLGAEVLVYGIGRP